MSTFILTATIRLDNSEDVYSGQPVLHPSNYIDGLVLSWGSINRSIPVPAGLPQVGDATFRLADTDFRFRNLFIASAYTPLDRVVDIRWMEAGTSYAAGTPVYTGVITGFEFGDGYLELRVTDQTLAWLDEEWPGTMDNGIYAPTIFGRCVQNSTHEQHGLIPLPHIGFDLAIGDRWILAWHTVNDVIAVHRHNLDGTWEVVAPAEYSITEDNVTIGGITTTGTYIDFTNLQDDGIEIRVDVEGWDNRPAWGSLGAASGLLRNPIDFYINMMIRIQDKIGQDFAFNTTAIIAIRTLFLTVIDTSPPHPYYCDGAILEPITMRSMLSRFLTSFNLDMFYESNPVSQLTLAFMHAADAGRPVFTETFDILEGSFRQFSPEAINRLKCKMARNYATGEWSIEQIHDNTADQTKLGSGSPIVPKIKAADLELWFVRDRMTATDVAAHRAGFLALTSYDVEFDLPLELGVVRDLCEQVGVTMTSGLASGGFSNQEVRVDGLTLDLSGFATKVAARIWREQERNTPSFVIYELDGSIALTSAVDGEVVETI